MVTNFLAYLERDYLEETNHSAWILIILLVLVVGAMVELMRTPLVEKARVTLLTEKILQAMDGSTRASLIASKSIHTGESQKQAYWSLVPVSSQQSLLVNSSAGHWRLLAPGVFVMDEPSWKLQVAHSGAAPLILPVARVLRTEQDGKPMSLVIQVAYSPSVSSALLSPSSFSAAADLSVIYRESSLIDSFAETILRSPDHLGINKEHEQTP